MDSFVLSASISATFHIWTPEGIVLFVGTYCLHTPQQQQTEGGRPGRVVERGWEEGGEEEEGMGGRRGGGRSG